MSTETVVITEPATVVQVNSNQDDNRLTVSAVGLQGPIGNTGPQGIQGVAGPTGAGLASHLTDLDPHLDRLYTRSRGDNLMVNGSGLFQADYNFEWSAFSRETHGGQGSFLMNTNQNSASSNEVIPVDPTKSYRLNFWARSGDDNGANYFAANIQYFGFVVRDATGLSMDALHRYKFTGSVNTTLTADLVAGQTTMTVASASGWHNGAVATQRQFSWWPYVDTNGTGFAAYTYSRNTSGLRVTGSVANGTWGNGGIVGNVITLTAPWTGATLPAGTPVQNTQYGGTYLYTALGGVAVPNVWTRYSATLLGQNLTKNSERDGFMLPPGAANVQFLVLNNYHGAANNNLRMSDISFTEHGALGEDVDARGDTVTTAGNIFMLSSPGSRGHILGLDEGVIYLNCTSGNKTIILPDVTQGPLNPIKWTFIRTDATANTITYSRTGSNLVNGGTTMSGQTAQGSARTFVHNGTDWFTAGGYGA